MKLVERYPKPMVINEWQLDVKLNRALQQSHRSDFAFYLSLLSPAVEESAPFQTPEPLNQTTSTDLHQQLGIVADRARSYAMLEGDDVVMQYHSEALQQSGLAQLKLTSYLNPPPLVQFDDKSRIDTTVWQSLSLHTRRHLQKISVEKPDVDPTSLYEVLQDLHSHATA